METISWNAMGEGAYENIDYVTINGYAFNLDLIKAVSFSKERIDISFSVKHGFNSFLGLLHNIADKSEIITARCSNYHGGYLLASGVVLFEGDTFFTLPDTMVVSFKALNVALDTFSTYEENIYMTEVKKKD